MKAVQVAVLLLSALPCAAKELPRYFGDDTATRKVIERAEASPSRIHTSHIWTHGNSAVIAVLYPGPNDYRLEDCPPGVTPWRWAWISSLDFLQDKETQQVVRQSTFHLILREQDGKTCVVNSLEGKRILTEGADAQDRTAVELPCADIWPRFGSLGLSPEEQQAVNGYLTTPPSPPKWPRKVAGDAGR